MSRCACEEPAMTSVGGPKGPENTLLVPEWMDLSGSGTSFGETVFPGLIKWVASSTWGCVTEFGH